MSFNAQGKPSEISKLCDSHLRSATKARPVRLNAQLAEYLFGAWAGRRPVLQQALPCDLRQDGGGRGRRFGFCGLRRRRLRRRPGLGGSCPLRSRRNFLRVHGKMHVSHISPKRQRRSRTQVEAEGTWTWLWKSHISR